MPELKSLVQSPFLAQTSHKDSNLLSRRNLAPGKAERFLFGAESLPDQPQPLESGIGTF